MRRIDRRIGFLFLAFLGLLAIALLRATYLGAVSAAGAPPGRATQQVSTTTIPAPRGTITDRNGVELAISESADDIVADPYLIKNPISTAQKLAPLLGMPLDDGPERRDQAPTPASSTWPICSRATARRRSRTCSSTGSR